MGNEGDIERLIRELGSFRTRRAARQELESLGKAAAEPLLDALKDRMAPENTLWVAISLLGKCRHEPAIPTLAEILGDSPTLSRDAHRALVQICGKDKGTDPKAWMPETGQETGLEEPSSAEGEAAGEGGSWDGLAREALRDLEASVSTDADGSVSVRVGPESHPQQVVCVRLSTGHQNRRVESEVWLTVDCGPITPGLEAIMFRHNVALKYGVYSREKDGTDSDRAILRYRAAPDFLTAQHLRDVILGMVNDVIQLRSELAQTDRLYPWRASDPSADAE